MLLKYFDLVSIIWLLILSGIMTKNYIFFWFSNVLNSKERIEIIKETTIEPTKYSVIYNN